MVEKRKGASSGQTPVWLRERVPVNGRGKNWTVPDNEGGAKSRLRDPGIHTLQNFHLTDENTEAREGKFFASTARARPHMSLALVHFPSTQSTCASASEAGSIQKGDASLLTIQKKSLAPQASHPKV